MSSKLKWASFGTLMSAVLMMASSALAQKPRDDLGGILERQDDLFKSCMVNVSKDCESWAKKGGGGEAPRGLRTDTKVELAIGETYILTGSVVIFENEVFLRINFEEQPWLANATRLRNPFYRIIADAASWKKFRGKEVTIVAKARYVVLKEDGRNLFGIYLVPGEDAVIPALQPTQRR
jgi:hypothetical protein